jgi:hypothetical protein
MKLIKVKEKELFIILKEGRIVKTCKTVKTVLEFFKRNTTASDKDLIFIRNYVRLVPGIMSDDKQYTVKHFYYFND